MTPQPERDERLLNALLSAMQNVNNATMHLIAIDPYLGPIPEIARLEDIFAKLKGKYNQQVAENQTHA